MKAVPLLLALLMAASPPASAEIAAPRLADTRTMSIALVSHAFGDCAVDSARLDSSLNSIAHGPGFPAITTASDNPDVPSFIVIVTTTAKPKTPGFNPAAKDRQATCSVTGSAMLLRGGAGVEGDASRLIVWEASLSAEQHDISPSSVDGPAEHIVRDLTERFGTEWRQSQEQ